MSKQVCFQQLEFKSNVTTSQGIWQASLCKTSKPLVGEREACHGSVIQGKAIKDSCTENPWERRLLRHCTPHVRTARAKLQFPEFTPAMAHAGTLPEPRASTVSQCRYDDGLHIVTLANTLVVQKHVLNILNYTRRASPAKIPAIP